VELLAAAALFVIGVIPGWIATAWLLWRVRALRRHVQTLETRLGRLETPAAPHADAAPAPAAAPIAPFAPEPAPVITPAAIHPAAPPPSPRRALPQDGETLESWIGGQWLLYIGVLAILVGVAYFEKLAFESAWLGETARVVQGAVAGLILVYAGIRFARAGYAGYGHAIAGAGVAALYVSTYASFNFYHLIGRTTAFVLMLIVTGGAAALADRQRSQGLAVLAVGGGYLTPFLLPGTSDTEIALFGYDAVLAAGASALARRRIWPLLYAASYLATLVTVAAWADSFYTPDKYLRTELFLTLFCALFVFMLVRCRRHGTAAETVAWLFLSTAPIAYYVASIAILVPHSTAFLVWAVAAAGVGAVLAVHRSPGWGLLIDIAVLVPLLLWCSAPAARGHLADGLWATAGVYAIALVAQIRTAGANPASPSFVAWLHFNGLGAFAAAYLLLLFDHVALTSVAAAVFAAWHGGVAFVLRRDAPEPSLHAGALGLTLVAIAIALQFDGPAVTIGWGAEGFGIIALGLHTRRAWVRTGGVVLFAIAFVRAMSLLTATPVVGQAVVFNRRAACALFLVALAYAIAALLKKSGADRGWLATTSILAAQLLTLLWLTSEIRAYWSARQEALTRELMLSVTWAAYATVLVVVGLRRRFAPLRIFAMVVLAITIVKVFVVDLAQLQRVYRVASVVGLGVMLLLTSYLYQKSRGGTPLGSSGADGDENGAAGVQ
jgi:uncharacterized membrane protein